MKGFLTLPIVLIAGMIGILLLGGGYVISQIDDPQTLGAQPALTTFQGGTGSTSPSGLLYGDGSIRLKTVTIGSNLTFAGGTLSGSAGGASFPFTANTWGNSTGTVISFPGIISVGSTSLPYLGTGAVGTNNGRLYNSATTTASTGLTYSVSGNSFSVDLGTSIDLASAEVTGDLPFSNIAQLSANTVWGNRTAATADGAGLSTTTQLFNGGTPGQVLMWNGAGYYPFSTSTLTNGTGITTTLAGNTWTVTNTGVTSLTNGTGITCSGTAPGSCSLAAIAANSVLANNTSASAIPAAVSTSTLYGAGITPGYVLTSTNGAWLPMATATCVQITGGSGLCDGNDATSVGQNPFTWADTYATTAAATSSNVWFQQNVYASSTIYVGQGGATASSSVTVGPGGNEWIFGYLGADKTFRISSSSDSLSVLSALTIDKNLKTTLVALSVPNATTTNLSVTASSTLATLFGAGLSACTGTNALTWTGGLFTCTAQPQGTVTSVAGTANQIDSSGGAAPTLTLSSHVIFPASFQASRGTTTNATSTNLTVTASSTLATVFGAGLGTCNTGNALTWSAGLFGCTPVAAFSFPFVPATNFAVAVNSTTTLPIWFTQGIHASTTSQFHNINIFGNGAITATTSVRGAGLVIASTTAPQTILTDGSVGFGFRSVGGKFYIATTSPINAATTTASTVFSITQSGGACLGIGCTSTSTSGTLTLRDKDGIGPILNFGGNPGGDTDWILRRWANNDATSNDRLAFLGGGFERLTLTANGGIGFASSSPSALWGVTVATSTVFQFTQFGGSIASSSASAALYNVDWETGNTQRFALNQNAEIVINATSSHPRDGFSYKLKFCQDGAGSRTLSFKNYGQLNWGFATTVISSGANTASWIGMIYDARTQRYDILASTTNIHNSSCLP